MTKTKLNRLYLNRNFEVTEWNDTTTFIYNKILEPLVTIDDMDFRTVRPIKKIILIRNHILQSNELELKSENDELLLHINLDGSIEDISITYNRLE